MLVSKYVPQSNLERQPPQKKKKNPQYKHRKGKN